MAEERRLNIRPVGFNPVVDKGSDTTFGFLVKDAMQEVDLTDYTPRWKSARMRELAACTTR